MAPAEIHAAAVKIVALRQAKAHRLKYPGEAARLVLARRRLEWRLEQAHVQRELADGWTQDRLVETTEKQSI